MTGIWSISSRNTPTCVGKTWTGVSPAFAPWKHPHVRGEDFNTALWKIGLQGNTPTCVGKTKNFLLAVRVAQKHPHVRGEDGLRRTGGQSRTETPPRAWGRRGSALVGPRRPKHPHVRGEDQNTTNMAMCQGETPPRAWGRRILRPRKGAFLGNTPTCVGKTSLLSSKMEIRQKHPHVRGEDDTVNKVLQQPIETPPRAWGRHAKEDIEKLEDRNTPTCVGKTSIIPASAAPRWKHPHVRGEDTERLFTFFIEPSKQY